MSITPTVWKIAKPYWENDLHRVDRINADGADALQQRMDALQLALIEHHYRNDMRDEHKPRARATMMLLEQRIAAGR